MKTLFDVIHEVKHQRTLIDANHKMLMTLRETTPPTSSGEGSDEATCSIPSWSDIEDKIERSERITPLEQFIWDFEPSGDPEEGEFREQLTKVILFLSNAQAHTHDEL